MAHIIMFHHAQGLTQGITRIGDSLASAGHSVAIPDMYEGLTFATVEEGVAHAEEISFDVAFARAAATLASPNPQSPGSEPTEPVFYVGFSMGAVHAAQHALDDPNAKGLILMHAAVDPDWFPQPWPRNLFVQVHASEEDPWMEFDALESLTTITQAYAPTEVHLYPGSDHLFSDESVPEFNPDLAQTSLARIAEFIRNHA